MVENGGGLDFYGFNAAAGLFVDWQWIILNANGINVYAVLAWQAILVDSHQKATGFMTSSDSEKMPPAFHPSMLDYYVS